MNLYNLKDMKKNEHIAYWLETARNDLDTAETLYASGKYEWSLFLGHLVIEKTLKAVFAAEHDSVLPPRTHNLVRLIQATTLPVDEDIMLWLDRVNDFHIEARYPDFKREFSRVCTKEFTKYHLVRIKEYFEWLKSHLKSDPS